MCLSVVFALTLELEGQCVDREQLLSFVQSEIEFSQATGSLESELWSVVTCVGDEARFLVGRGGSEHSASVSLKDLEDDLKERTLALAIAEAVPLLRPPEQDAVEAAPPTPPPVLMALEELGSAVSVADGAPDRPMDASAQPGAEMLAGGAVRVYPSGIALIGGSLELRVARLGLSSTLLTTVGTAELRDSAYTNLSAGLSYTLLTLGAPRLQGSWGAKLTGGYTSSDDALRGYVGAGAFAAMDVGIARAWRARVEGEVGHAGWSADEQLRPVQGVYFSAMLALGVGGDI